MKKVLVAACGLLVVRMAWAERPYEFRAELETVHEPGLRDGTLTVSADEFAFANVTVIVLPEVADEVLENAAKDFTGCWKNAAGNPLSC